MTFAESLLVVLIEIRRNQPAAAVSEGLTILGGLPPCKVKSKGQRHDSHTAITP